MLYETLQVSIAGNVVTVTLNRPDVLNALNAQMLHELDEVFEALDDDDKVRAVLLHGAGGKAFAAGADIAGLAEINAESGEPAARRGQRVFRRIETLGKPVIACIDGFALGGGCELALACTFRLANERARLGQPEIKLGLIPGYGGTQRLPRLIGPSAALRLILTGAMIDAAEALRLGLIDELVPGNTIQPLLARARELAESIASMPPLAVTAALESVCRGIDMPLDDALELEAGLFGRLCGTEDKREGTAAFLEKRAPSWRGR